eukprot:5596861-Pleurochrysis_carterae.AAC.2
MRKGGRRVWKTSRLLARPGLASPSCVRASAYLRDLCMCSSRHPRPASTGMNTYASELATQKCQWLYKANSSYDMPMSGLALERAATSFLLDM